MKKTAAPFWLALCVAAWCGSPLAQAAETPRARPLEWAQPVISQEALKNFYQLNREIYRAAQPDEEGMQALTQLDIKSVLNLREFHSDRDEAKETALVLYHVPMAAGVMEDEKMVEALATLHRAEKPILVHCWHGSDRTGAVLAMYRIIFEGWSKAAAIEELKLGGYGHHEIFYKNIPRYIEAADIEVLRAEVLRAKIR